MKFLDPIKECYAFLNHPFRRSYTVAVEEPITYVNILFIFAFAINIFLLSIISNFVDFENMDSVFSDFETNVGKFGMFAIAVILAPIMEELIFRFPLRNKIALTFLLAGLDAIIVSVVCTAFGYDQLAIYLPPVTAILTVMLIFLVPAIKEEWDISIDQFYPYLFFFVAGLFAFIHIYNYSPEGYEWWMTPFIVVPQFVLALFLGFVRLRVGLWASIYMHALNNAIPIAFMLLSDSSF